MHMVCLVRFNGDGSDSAYGIAALYLVALLYIDLSQTGIAGGDVVHGEAAGSGGWLDVLSA